MANEKLHKTNVSAKEALEKLKAGNENYVSANVAGMNISKEIREDTCHNGQHPYAIVIACSDSRVIPEGIFMADIGDLFVIRLAGNVIDNHQLGSIEYAAGHLGCRLIVMLGHTHCGAVDAAMHHDEGGYIKFITDQIKEAIGEEKDERKACELNVRYNQQMINNSLDIQKMEEADGLQVVSAIYDIETGKVEFLS